MGELPSELYVYWRLARADLGAAREALKLWQRRLRSECAGLSAGLYVRADEAADEATLMETYRFAVGNRAAAVTPALQARLRAEGDLLSAPWRHGPRHFEVFVPCPD